MVGPKWTSVPVNIVQLDHHDRLAQPSLQGGSYCRVFNDKNNIFVKCWRDSISIIADHNVVLVEIFIGEVQLRIMRIKPTSIRLKSCYSKLLFSGKINQGISIHFYHDPCYWDKYSVWNILIIFYWYIIEKPVVFRVEYTGSTWKSLVFSL